MKKYERRNRLLWALAAAGGISFLAFVYWCPVSEYLFRGSVFFVIAFSGILMLQYQNMKTYMETLLIQLSDLIAVITELKDDEVFPGLEDTLLSKLQDQITKLTGILTMQREAFRSERDELKSLVSDISHQLKTPMATLSMYGEFITAAETSEEERREYLAILSETIAKLNFLTDSMIKVSRLESGIIKLQQETAVINETVLAAIRQVHQMAIGKGIDMELEELCGQLCLQHDKRWTEEAIFNILDNAVKYTQREGCIKIVIGKYEMYCRIDVIDNGRGIPEAEQAQIFQRFYRGTQAGQEEGAGIGLYLCRKIIMDQGGYVKVSSDDKGTMFSVFLRMEGA